MRLLEVSIQALQLQPGWREGGATASDLELSESINETNVIKVGNKYSTRVSRRWRCTDCPKQRMGRGSGVGGDDGLGSGYS